jgi:hypothetical protein
MRSWTHLSTLALLFVGGVGLLVLGMTYTNTLHMVFGVLGMVLAVQMAKFCLVKAVSPNQWLLEHLGAFIGSGIGAYTAFLAFGGRRVFSELGDFQLVFWIAPGVIGSMTIARLSRKYKKGLAVTRKAVR